MNKIINLFFCFCLVSNIGFSQQIIKSKLIINKPAFLNLYTFDGVIEKSIGSAAIDKNGYFEIKLNIKYEGMSYFKINGKKIADFYLYENTKIDSISDRYYFNKSDKKNTMWSEYMKDRYVFNSNYKALKDLLFIYRSTPELFDLNFISQVEDELSRIELLKKNTERKLATLPAIYNMQVCRLYIEKLYQYSINRKGDYSSFLTFPKACINESNILNGGFVRSLIDGYYSIAAIDVEKSKVKMQDFLTFMLDNIKDYDNTKIESIASYMLMSLERFGLSNHNQFLADMIRKTNCTLNNGANLIDDFYTNIKIDLQAPDISFKNNKLGDVGYENLSQIPNKVKVLIFGDSNCPKCKYDLNMLLRAKRYVKELKDIAVIYIDLADKKAQVFDKNDNVIHYKDNKQWDSDIVRSYYVYAAPTYVVMNEDNKIIQVPTMISEFLSKFTN
ncbi:MAG: thioredoxin family protein [Marinifilaceae bacterium]|jgi:hypothetical protein|nr:thioredoxin family protein [Marinifilaceae bacterium]